MTKENHKLAPSSPRIVELRACKGAQIASNADPVDVILNQNLGELNSYKSVNVDDEWSSFMKKIG